MQAQRGTDVALARTSFGVSPWMRLAKDGVLVLRMLGYGKPAQLTERATGKPVATLEPDCQVIALAPDGSGAATATRNGTIRIWSLRGEERHRFETMRAMQQMALSPDGRRLLAVYADGDSEERPGAELWSLDGKRLARFANLGAPEAFPPVFSRDGRTILGLSHRGQRVGLWKEDGSQILTVKPDLLTGTNPGDIRRVETFCFFPEERRFVTASGTSAQVWNRDGDEIVAFRGHGARVHDAAVAPDGTRVVTVGADGAARIWGLDGLERSLLRCNQALLSVVRFTDDGRHIYAANNATATRPEVYRWVHTADDLLKLASDRITRGFTQAERARYAPLLRESPEGP